MQNGAKNRPANEIAAQLGICRMRESYLAIRHIALNLDHVAKHTENCRTQEPRRGFSHDSFVLFSFNIPLSQVDGCLAREFFGVGTLLTKAAVPWPPLVGLTSYWPKPCELIARRAHS
jgi:hypothetical protein